MSAYTHQHLLECFRNCVVPPLNFSMLAQDIGSFKNRLISTKLLDDIESYSGDDPLRPWIACITWAMKNLPVDSRNSTLRLLLQTCVHTFEDEKRYHSDVRFLQTCIRYADCCYPDGEEVFLHMEGKQIGQESALFYGGYAIVLEAQKKFSKANEIYQLGLQRQAKPLALLEEQHKGFLKRLEKSVHRFVRETRPASCGKSRGDPSLSSNSEICISHPLMELSNNQREPHHHDDILSPKPKGLHQFLEPLRPCKKDDLRLINCMHVDPWDPTIIEKLLNGLNPPLSRYKGFYQHQQKYKGVKLSALKSTSHNKIMELGSRRYHLKGCTGQGAFAHVFKASEERNQDKIVVLKIQQPACPWEFYIYSQLDKRIPEEERVSFGRASKMHSYEDYSIMVCAYGQHGTLQDVVNSYLATGQRMDELLCMYYSIEMLRMLEVLHSAGLIHGDFKPDNLLIRNESEVLEDWAPERPQCWKDQGLCLIDWGRSIDMKLFPADTEFTADCNTSGFRCVEMQQQRPWTYQIDTYAFCCIVHVMLHGSYMEIDLKDNAGNICPKVPFRRYHKREIWEELFTTLLNVKSCEVNPSLGELRRMLENYLLSNTQSLKKIRTLMLKQNTMMSSKK